MIDYLMTIYRTYDLLDIQIENFEKKFSENEYRLIVVDNTPNSEKKEIKNKEILHINNHINKSGTNPFLKTNTNKIEFYDITQIYQQKKEGIITTCLGKKYKKNKNKEKNPSAFLAYFAIHLHIKGYKVVGKLFNLKR